MSNPTELVRTVFCQAKSGNYIAHQSHVTCEVCAQPEGEAPQADVEAAAKAIYQLLPPCQGASAKEYPWQAGGNSRKQDEAREYARAALATLSPLCGAQVAESGKEEFAWAVFAENGNVIIWSKNRAQVESASKEYGRPIVPVIALSAAQLDGDQEGSESNG